MTDFFHVVDLAGAERPSKAGQGEDVSSDATGGWAAHQVMKGETIAVFEEGLLINCTLFELRKEVKLVTGLHKSNKPHRAPRQLGMPLTKCLGKCIDGRALLAMIVCVSQAPQCGWETWILMNYGNDLASLCTPVIPVKWFDLHKAAERCKDLQNKAAQALAKHERVHANSVVPSTEAKERLWLLKVLQGMQHSN